MTIWRRPSPAIPTASPASPRCRCRARTRAANELVRAVKELGFRRRHVNGTTEGRFLDHPSLTDLLAAAVELDVPIYIHPHLPPEAVRQAYFSDLPPGAGRVLETAGWGWHSETAIHVLRMVLAGTLDRHPRLKLIIGHMGEMLPMMLDRIDEVFALDVEHLERPISRTILDQVWITTSGIFNEPPFLAALLTFGIDRIMFSVDYPVCAECARAANSSNGISLSPGRHGKAHARQRRCIAQVEGPLSGPEAAASYLKPRRIFVRCTSMAEYRMALFSLAGQSPEAPAGTLFRSRKCGRHRQGTAQARRQRLVQFSAARRQRMDRDRRAQQCSRQLHAAHRSRFSADDRRGLYDRPQCDPARLHDRQQHADRHGGDRDERRTGRRQLHHRRRRACWRKQDSAGQFTLCRLARAQAARHRRGDAQGHRERSGNLFPALAGLCGEPETCILRVSGGYRCLDRATMARED